jgi:ABC-2 type transport system ATP-binding protein
MRLVMAEGFDPPAASTLGTVAVPRPVTPRFEDAYVALLTRRATAEIKPVSSAAAALGDRPPDPVDGLVIETRDLTRVFGTFTAVDKITLEVVGGEIFGLLGPNGAGKSTTFKMLCGLLPPSAGMARVAGFDMMRARASARSAIGYMAQTFAHPGDLTVRQNLAFNTRIYGVNRRESVERIAEVLDSFGLKPYADTASSALPLGIQRRLSLACAILHRPRILFLDEPTSGVDPLMRRDFWQRINDMAADGVTVMVTSHFLDEAEYCDRLGIVYRGRLIALGEPDAIRRQHAKSGGDDASLEDAFINLIHAYDREYAA